MKLKNVIKHLIWHEICTYVTWHIKLARNRLSYDTMWYWYDTIIYDREEKSDWKGKTILKASNVENIRKNKKFNQIYPKFILATYEQLYFV